MFTPELGWHLTNPSFDLLACHWSHWVLEGTPGLPGCGGQVLGMCCWVAVVRSLMKTMAFSLGQAPCHYLSLF